jgi:hypothetical protein
MSALQAQTNIPKTFCNSSNDPPMSTLWIKLIHLSLGKTSERTGKSQMSGPLHQFLLFTLGTTRLLSRMTNSVNSTQCLSTSLWTPATLLRDGKRDWR